MLADFPEWLPGIDLPKTTANVLSPITAANVAKIRDKSLILK
jgi:hypothetical protein